MDDLYWPFDISRVSEWPGGVFDYRPGVHMGTDFAIAQGTELRATTSGVIRNYKGNTGGWGIDIVRPDGWVVRNWHMSEFFVSNGQKVNSGDVIGLTGGAKGHPGAGLSTGPHLHWEIRSNSGWGAGWVDPRTLNPKNFSEKPNNQEDDDMIAIVYLHKDANPVNIGDTVSKDGMQWIAMPGIFQHIDSPARKQILESKIPNLKTISVNSLELVNLYSAFKDS
jgi:murein DD-endopeptidase MepM/ murein hydrolase activator NlpD